MTRRLDLPRSSFCSTEKSVVPSAAGTTISPSTMALPALIRWASAAILLEAPGPVIAAASEYLDVVIVDVQLDAVAVEFDLVNPTVTGRHLVARGRQRGLDESGEGRLHADRRRLPTLKRHTE